jgi:hypothetical protein
VYTTGADPIISIPIVVCAYLGPVWLGNRIQWPGDFCVAGRHTLSFTQNSPKTSFFPYPSYTPKESPNATPPYVSPKFLAYVRPFWSKARHAFETVVVTPGAQWVGSKSGHKSCVHLSFCCRSKEELHQVLPTTLFLRPASLSSATKRTAHSVPFAVRACACVSVCVCVFVRVRL